MRNAFVIAVLSMSAVGFAQDAFDMALSDVRLLQTDEVRKELNVTQAQRDRMNRASAGYNRVAERVEAKLRKEEQPSEADRKAMESEFGKMRTGVLRVLNPNQLRRLREITMQTVGLPLLVEPNVMRRLKITSQQKSTIESTFRTASQQLETISREVNQKVEREFRNEKPKNEAERRRVAERYQRRMGEEMRKVAPRVEKIQSDARNRIMRTLSEAQRKQWDALLGRPFNPGR